MNGEDSSSFKVERKSVSRSTVKSGEDDNVYIIWYILNLMNTFIYFKQL